MGSNHRFHLKGFRILTYTYNKGFILTNDDKRKEMSISRKYQSLLIFKQNLIKKKLLVSSFHSFVKPERMYTKR